MASVSLQVADHGVVVGPGDGVVHAAVVGFPLCAAEDVVYAHYHGILVERASETLS